MNNDRDSDQKFLGPGMVTGSFTFNLQGILLTGDEFYAYSDAGAAEAVPAVPLTEGEGEPLAVMTAIPLTEDADRWAWLYLPDGHTSPAVTVEGLDVGECFPTDRNPTSPMWAVGLSGLLKGDGGEAFSQFVRLPVIPGSPRTLDSLQPELVHAAILCLARPGPSCEFEPQHTGGYVLRGTGSARGDRAILPCLQQVELGRLILEQRLRDQAPSYRAAGGWPGSGHLMPLAHREAPAAFFSQAT